LNAALTGEILCSAAMACSARFKEGGGGSACATKIL